MNLPDPETLRAIGISLVMVGVVMRGFAASARRDQARRKEHMKDERKSHIAHLNDDLEKPPGWLERNLGLVANVILVAGVVITVAGFVRD
jgi:hypothetical protein